MNVTITEALPEIKAIASELGLELNNFKVKSTDKKNTILMPPNIMYAVEI